MSFDRKSVLLHITKYTSNNNLLNKSYTISIYEKTNFKVYCIVIRSYDVSAYVYLRTRRDG